MRQQMSGSPLSHRYAAEAEAVEMELNKRTGSGVLQ